MKKVIKIGCLVIVIVLLILYIISVLQYLQHNSIASINSINWGLNSTFFDYWSGKYYKIYSDGEVEYYDLYNLNGKKDEGNFRLSYFDTIKIKLLLKIGTNMPVDRDSVCDGMGWHFSLLDRNGNTIKEHIGYIENNFILKEVINTLKSTEEMNK